MHTLSFRTPLPFRYLSLLLLRLVLTPVFILTVTVTRAQLAPSRTRDDSTVDRKKESSIELIIDQDAKRGETITLSPFIVTAENDNGYQAADTLAGTRLRTSLSDVGASVQVLTSEFLSDIGANDANDVLLFSTSTETFGLGGNFSGGLAKQGDRVDTSSALENPQGTNRVRGLGPPDLTRDFFLTDIPFDSYNTDRIEINRGANAILFGLGSPSGILNAGLEKAAFKNKGSVGFQVTDQGGRYGYRENLDVNRILIPDVLAFRLDVLNENKKFQQNPTFQDQQREYLAITFKPFKNTTLRVSGENGSIRANYADPVGPLQAIDEYLRVRDEYHEALALDPDPPVGDNLPVIYDPWGFANYEYQNLSNGVNNYANPLSTEGLNASLAQVWSGNTKDPDYGFAAVIPGNIQVDQNNSMPGFQHSVYNTTAFRPNNPPSPRAAQFYRVDNAGRKRYEGVYEGFVDLELYDFSRHLLAGTAPFNNRDFQTYNVSIEQTYLKNRLGWEAAFTHESFSRSAFAAFPGRTMGVMVDINTTLPTGQQNPNFGRPFMVGKATRNDYESEKETARFTAFYDFQFSDILGRSTLSEILGRHIITGLVSRYNNRTEKLNFSQRSVGVPSDHLNEIFNTLPDPRQFNYLVYIGPAVDLISDPASLTRGDFVIYDDPITTQEIWNPGGNPVTSTYFDKFSQQMVTNDIGKQALAINGQKFSTRDDTLAFNLQSYLLNDLLVSTVGWRRDVVYDEQVSSPVLVPAEDENGNPNTLAGTIQQDEEGNYIFDDPDVNNLSDNIVSWSLVAKLPRRFLPEGVVDDVSLFFNTSSNFQPAPGRKDHFGDSLPSPSGSSEEWGVNVTLFRNKFSMRVTRFESSIIDASNSTVDTTYQKTVGIARSTISNLLNSLAYGDPNEIDENSGQLLRMPIAESEALLNEYLNFFGATLNRQTGEYTLDASNPNSKVWTQNNWRPVYNSSLGLVEGLDQNLSTMTDTVDQVAKGWEFEVVGNPMKGLRVALNVAKVETSNSNIAPRLTDWVDNDFGAFHAGTPVDPSKFGLLIASDPTINPALRPGADRLVDNWNTDVLRDFLIIKAQEGTFTPELSKWRSNFVANYDFTRGRLRGVGFGANVRWQSKVALGYPTELDADGIARPVISKPYYGPSVTNVGFRLAYRHKIFQNRLDWKVQLNVQNAFTDREELIPVRVTDTGVVAQARTAAPRTFILSNTIAF